MAATFYWVPSTGFSKDSTPRVLSTKFGEGYGQRISEGLNTLDNTWQLSFVNQDAVTAIEIEMFLATAGTGDYTEGGKGYFFWTPPNELITYKVICPSWKLEYTSHISATITATFVRVYE